MEFSLYCTRKVTDTIWWVGGNDRRLALFENLFPIPHGVSYNSYVIMDEKTALMDTTDPSITSLFLANVAHTLNGRKLDYLIINHMEPDHCSNIEEIMHRYPETTLVCNAKTLQMIGQFYDLDLTGRTMIIKEGDTLSLGSHTLHFVAAPMVHWPEVMMVYEDSEKILFSADAFGTFGTLDGGVIDTELNLDHFWEEMRRYYSNIVGKYGNPVQKALQKLSGLDIQTICSTHGPVWTAHIPEVIKIYDELSRYEGQDGVVIVYGSMYGNTEQMAEAIASSLSAHGVKNIVMHNASKSHSSYIIKDMFKYKAVIIGCPTYCNQLYPEIDSLLQKIEIRELKNRLFGYFGSFSWAGAAVKRLAAFAEKMNWTVVGEPVEQKQGLKQDKYEACWALGKAMAEQLNSK